MQDENKKTKREEFLEIMDEITPWEEMMALIEPYYYKNHLGHRAKGIETMLRMYLLANWFNLSDEAVEDAIHDSYAMRKFMGIDFVEGGTFKPFSRHYWESSSLFCCFPLDYHLCQSF